MGSWRLALERATLARCVACGHAVTVACPRHRGPDDYAAVPGARRAFERQYLPARLRSYARGLTLLGPARGRALLDIGSNYGDFLALAASRGWHVVGVEPGEALRPYMIADMAPVTVRSLDEAAAVAPFGAITLWDVLEHLPAPERQLVRLAELLEPGGLLLLRVPDARVFGALASSRRWRVVRQAYLAVCHPTNPEEHVSHFTPVSMRLMARGAGLRECAEVVACFDERVVSGWTRLDVALRRAMHLAGRGLPYEFTMTLTPSADGS